MKNKFFNQATFDIRFWSKVVALDELRNPAKFHISTASTFARIGPNWIWNVVKTYFCPPPPLHWCTVTVMSQLHASIVPTTLCKYHVHICFSVRSLEVRWKRWSEWTKSQLWVVIARRFLLNRSHFIADLDRPQKVLILPKIWDKWALNFLSYCSSKLAENGNSQNWAKCRALLGKYCKTYKCPMK